MQAGFLVSHLTSLDWAPGQVGAEHRPINGPNFGERQAAPHLFTKDTDMARAQGARAQMALAFETVYGTAPASGYTRVPFASTSLGAEQPLLTSELLGYGRDPSRRSRTR